MYQVREVQKQAATTSAVAWTIFLSSNFDVPRIDIAFGATTTSAGNVTVTKDSVEGAAYDCVISTTDAQAKDQVVITGLTGFVKGDKLLIEYANPDSVSVTATATLEIPN
jgi:hypothetical protein